MNTFRIQKHERDFTTVKNDFIEDKNLSMKAKGLLLYFLHLRDDWEIYETELRRHFSDGKDAIHSGILELIKAGYIVRREKPKVKGQYQSYEYTVYESLDLKEKMNRCGFSATDNPQVTNTNRSESISFSEMLSQTLLPIKGKEEEFRQFCQTKPIWKECYDKMKDLKGLECLIRMFFDKEPSPVGTSQ